MVSSLLRLFPWKRNFGSSNWTSQFTRIRFISGKVDDASSNCRSPGAAAANESGGFVAVSDESVSISPSTTSSPPPWLMLPPTFGENRKNVYNFYSISEDKVVNLKNTGGGEEDEEEEEIELFEKHEIVGSSHGWLALCNHREEQQFLFNPLSNRRVELPPTDALPVHEDYEDYCTPLNKLIISCSPEEEHCVAMMSYSMDERLAFCSCPSRAAAEWTQIGEWSHAFEDKTLPRAYQDFVYSGKHKLFFCVTEFGDFEAWDFKDPNSPAMTPVDLKSDKDNYPYGSSCKMEEYMLKRESKSVKYLVVAEQTGELFLVRRFILNPEYDSEPVSDGKSVPYMTVSFDVHKIDLQKGELIYMESSLDGLAIFIGINHGFAISAAEELKLSPNSIYFTDSKEYCPRYWDKDREYGGHDNGVFNYETRTFSSCYFPAAANSETQSIKRIVPPPIWFNP
ncbi:hypothetical protein ACP275_08G048000 [Erythranthe tilingii]